MTSIAGFVDIGDSLAPVGSPAWCKAAHVQLCVDMRDTDREVRRLKIGLNAFKMEKRWLQLTDDEGYPFQSWEDYVQYPEPNGLGRKPRETEAILLATDNELLGKVLGEHGGDRKSEYFRNQECNTHLKSGTAAWWLARLDRDGFVNLAAAVRAGELSANAAAIQAGFRKKPKKCCPECGHEWR